MRSRFLLLVVWCVAASVAPVAAQTDGAARLLGTFSDLSSGPTGPPLNGVVQAVATAPDGTVYVGGTFTAAGDATLNGVAMRRPGTSWWAPLPDGAAVGVSGSVGALAVAPDGSVYVGGSFYEAGGRSARNVARWVPVGTQGRGRWEALGTDDANGTEANVTSLAFAPDGSLYVGGPFRLAGVSTSGGTVTANGVARWKPAERQWEALGGGLGGTVDALDVAPDGSVYVAGLFSTAGGSGSPSLAVSNVARWVPGANGAPGTWYGLGTIAANGVNGRVDDLTVAPDGSVYVGGAFSRAGGTEAQGGVAATNVARWVAAPTDRLPGGTPSAGQWEPLAVGTFDGIYNRVSAVEAADDGTVIVGGSFTDAAGVYALYVARWVPASVSGGTTGLWDALRSEKGVGVGGGVRALATADDGSVIVGGEFARVATYTVPSGNVARWRPGTTGALGTWEAFGSATDRTVEALAAAVDGTEYVYAGGQFFATGGVAGRGIARLGPVPGGSPGAYAWQTLEGQNGLNGVEWGAQAIAPAPDGSVYAVGGFERVVGPTAVANFLTVHGTARWVPGPDGAPGEWQPLGSGLGPNGYARAAALGPDGTLYVGGSFTSAGGVAASNIARWVPAGSGAGGAWEALGAGVTGEPDSTSAVYALAFGADGNLYVGGDFVAAGGTPARNVARWTPGPDGGTWAPLGAGTDDDVLALAVMWDGVVAGGAFTQAGGASAGRIALWKEAAWVPLGTGMDNGTDDAEVRSIVGYPNGQGWIAAGRFETADGVAASNVAVWSATGSAWESIGLSDEVNGTDAPVNALALDNGWGDLVLGGEFGTAGGTVSPFVSRFRIIPIDAAEGGAEAAAPTVGVRPNPVASGGEVVVSLAAPGRVRVALYDVLGRRVAVLLDGERAAGEVVLPLDAGRLSPGVYVVRVEAGAARASRRVTVVR